MIIPTEIKSNRKDLITKFNVFYLHDHVNKTICPLMKEMECHKIKVDGKSLTIREAVLKTE
jgi:hypothetical protein